MPDVYTIAEAATRLDELVRRAAAGEEIILEGSGDRRVRLAEPVAVGQSKPLPFGNMKGKIRLAPDFDAPLPDDILKPLYGLSENEPWPGGETREAAAGHPCRAVDAGGQPQAETGGSPRVGGA